MPASTMQRFPIPVFLPTLPDPEELADGIRSVFASGRITVGEQGAGLEEEVRIRTGAKHAVAVSCGTSGLMLLLKALDLPKGGEVIVPTFTFAATAHALLWNDLKPVFCDCEPDSFTLDASAAEALITQRTAAIYPVCVFGVPGDLEAYQQIADKYGLTLLYDSAQGLGSTYRGQPIGGFGAGEVFSMSPTKVVTAMEGGIVTTNDDQLNYRIRSLRDYGKASDGEDMRWLGLSARMTEINALVGRWSLARLDTWIANRSKIMNRYMQRLGDVEGLSFQHIPAHCTSCRNYIVVLIDPAALPLDRDGLYAKLKEGGIQTKRYFHPAVHNQTLYRGLSGGQPRPLANSETISRRALALPMYSHMDIGTVDIICDQVRVLVL